MPKSIIVSTGCCIPSTIVPNDHFLENRFYDQTGQRLEKPNPEIIEKLYNITGIQARRYVEDTVTTSDIAYAAAVQALEGIDRETLDYIIVAQNFGDVHKGNIRTDIVPTLAARVKHRLEIKNPYTVAYDIPFGCPGWLQGMIMADYYIRSGDAKRILVIGAETLSRVSDPHDVDCMIFADGAGATLVEAGDGAAGILSHVTRSDTYKNVWLLKLGPSYNTRRNQDELFIKMDGHDIYKYALKTVPLVVKQALDKAGLGLGDVSKILMHQANAKMDHAILTRLFRLYGEKTVATEIMPMIIHWAGNSSVATIPTLLDRLFNGHLDGHRVSSGDNLVFASVGAGMNINAMVYRIP
ncbi:3-Oxoacyl-(Acyl-carrier-protein (ACP)) synthase III [Desulfosarcina cetonica]|uniref:3-oxoacyl-ACP synthase III family protein n=1 Tax=Desulfosarcina cetonica TaxID=90730 RepID=UPI0006D075F9|nr:ketoacyl-ACP synthase III [Desulfosarcina cetonica]VTR67674.1 3-Oxoacyl-(Acyl-carrier-protein (ACP)) synthase III [Desulfosarcina cetonica]